jgi:hypothetical protein
MRTITPSSYYRDRAEVDAIIARLGLLRDDVARVDIADDGSVDVLVYLRNEDGKFYLTPDRRVASRVVHDG